MSRNQALVAALIGAAYLAFSFQFDGALSHILAFIAGTHITAAFIIKE